MKDQLTINFQGQNFFPFKISLPDLGSSVDKFIKLHDRSLELHDAHKQIIALENELAEQTTEVNLILNY